MKKAFLIVLALLALSSCASIPAEGIDSTEIFTGSCVEDHFEQYFDCLAAQAGGSDNG